MRDETSARGSTLLAAKNAANSRRITRGPRPIPHRKLQSGGDGLFPKRFQPCVLTRCFSTTDTAYVAICCIVFKSKSNVPVHLTPLSVG